MKTNDITSIINSSNSLWADVLNLLVERNALGNDELAMPYNDPSLYVPNNGLCVKVKDLTPGRGMNHMQIENDKVILFYGESGQVAGKAALSKFDRVPLRGLEIIETQYDNVTKQIKLGYKLDSDSRMLPNREKAKLLAFAAELIIRSDLHIA